MPISYVLILSDNTNKLIINTKMLSNADEKPLINLSNKRLVYYEVFDSFFEANKRKETFESWPEKKIKFLIDFVNPLWEDWKEEIKN